MRGAGKGLAYDKGTPKEGQDEYILKTTTVIIISRF